MSIVLVKKDSYQRKYLKVIYVYMESENSNMKVNNIKIKSLSKAIKIIETLSYNPEGLTITNISNEANISISSTHHFLSTLISLKVIKQNNDKKYKIDNHFIDVVASNIYYSPLVKIVTPHLKKLHSNINENIALLKVKNFDLEVISNLQTSHAVRPFFTVTINEYHAAAVGKVMLAYMSNKEFKEYLSKVNIESYTKNTIIDINLLKKALDEVKKNKIAFDLEELEEGLFCIAVPVIYQKTRLVGVIGVSIPRQRFDDNKKEQISFSLKEISEKIAEELLYNL